MQIRKDRLSRLRQELIQLGASLNTRLLPLMSSDPLMKGTLYLLRRKCPKPSCRCMRGELHASRVLTASVSSKTKLWTVAPERVEEIRRCTQAYRRFCHARKTLLQELKGRTVRLRRILLEIEAIRLRLP